MPKKKKKKWQNMEITRVKLNPEQGGVSLLCAAAQAAVVGTLAVL